MADNQQIIFDAIAEQNRKQTNSDYNKDRMKKFAFFLGSAGAITGVVLAVRQGKADAQVMKKAFVFAAVGIVFGLGYAYVTKKDLL